MAQIFSCTCFTDKPSFRTFWTDYMPTPFVTYSITIHECTGSHCCMSVGFIPFWFNTPCQFTALLTLCSLIFCLMPFCCLMCFQESTKLMVNKTGWLHTLYKLHQSQCTHRLGQTTWFACKSSSLFYLQIPWHTQAKSQNTDTTMNNCKSNL